MPQILLRKLIETKKTRAAADYSTILVRINCHAATSSAGRDWPQYCSAGKTIGPARKICYGTGRLRASSVPPQFF